MPRQSGIRVDLTLFIPFKQGDLDEMSAAIAASKKLRTKEGLTALAELPTVEIEESSAKSTSREAAAA